MPPAENLSSLMSEAASHHSEGRLVEAESLYRRVLSSDPDYPDALHWLGVLCQQKGDSESALGYIMRAVALRPEVADFVNNLGNIHMARDEIDDAETCYTKAVSLDPTLPNARCNLGIIHRSRGDMDKATTCFRKVIEQTPDFAMAYLGLGNTLQDMGRQEEALACLKTLVSVSPDFPQGQFNFGFALKGADRPKEAEAALKRGLALTPDYAEAWNVLGEIQRDCAEPEVAMSSFRQALELKPGLSAAHMNLGTLLRDMGKLIDAEAAFSRALEINPNDACFHNSLGLVLMLRGRMLEARTAFRKALEIEPGYAAARSNLLLSLNYGNDDTMAVLAAHREYETIHCAVLTGEIAPHGNDRDPERRLKVGYVSADLRRHSVSCFLEPLLTAHDSSRVEVFCYAEVARPDEVTERLRGLAAHWRSILGMSDDAVAQQIRDDGIDILLDLNGHTAGNRLLVFARKPAPLQVTWLGYPNTTGLSAMDYRIGDAVTDGEGAEATMSEALLSLEGCFLCYGPPRIATGVSPAPFAECGHVTFGSFNNLSKMEDEVVAVWSQLLDTVPGSCLFLKCAQLSDEKMCDLVRERFVSRGVASERLELAGYASSLEAHLKSYGRMDIALDPFPYNGTTTTCEALWMGVPVITLTGKHHGGRVGASLLTALGLPELVAGDKDSYLALAAELAVDEERLKSLRAGLRERLTGSPLADAATFASKMEDAYRRIWKTWCGGHVGGLGGLQ